MGAALGISQPKMKPPAMPKPPAAPPSAGSPDVEAARQRQRRLSLLGQSRSGSLLTSAQGLTSPAYTAKKSLLGQ